MPQKNVSHSSLSGKLLRAGWMEGRSLQNSNNFLECTWITNAWRSPEGAVIPQTQADTVCIQRWNRALGTVQCCCQERKQLNFQFFFNDVNYPNQLILRYLCHRHWQIFRCKHAGLELGWDRPAKRIREKMTFLREFCSSFIQFFTSQNTKQHATVDIWEQRVVINTYPALYKFK